MSRVLPGLKNWVVCGGKQGWGGPAKSHSPETSPMKAPQGPHTEEQLGKPEIPCRDTLGTVDTALRSCMSGTGV